MPPPIRGSDAPPARNLDRLCRNITPAAGRPRVIEFHAVTAASSNWRANRDFAMVYVLSRINSTDDLRDHGE
ncbi:hypothetical protein [Salinisphaera sp.]|uniref:hypothetical protein n=1 Tax=Salinisphaera sp. TaxID=1914330 RepID=UPI003C7DF4B8